MKEEKKPTKRESTINCDYRVKLYEDGKYHWKYDLHLMKNPAVLLDLFWALGITLVIVGCLFLLIQSCDNGLHLEELSFVAKVMGIMAGIFLVLGLLGYLIYAAMLGWKYTVLFTMDENGLEHTQAPRAQKVGERIGCLTALVAFFTGKPGMAGTGILAASRTTMTSDFSHVRKVKSMRKMNTIKVNELLGKNRVYVSDEDFDFVYNYISSRCPKAKIR